MTVALNRKEQARCHSHHDHEGSQSGSKTLKAKIAKTTNRKDKCVPAVIEMQHLHMSYGRRETVPLGIRLPAPNRYPERFRLTFQSQPGPFGMED
jgi:hypothetical protein